MLPIALACGYLAACFFLSALALRFAPDSITARLLEQRIWLFAALPLLAAIDLVIAFGDTIRTTLRLALDMFDRVSGKKRRKKIRYSYFSYGHVQAKPRKRWQWRRTRSSRRSRGAYRRRVRA